MSSTNPMTETKTRAMDAVDPTDAQVKLAEEAYVEFMQQFAPSDARYFKKREAYQSALHEITSNIYQEGFINGYASALNKGGGEGFMEVVGV